MQTTATSSLFGRAHLEALFDELEKIGTELVDPTQPASSPQEEKKWKKVLKTTAGYALGYGAGHMGGMLADYGAQKILKHYPGPLKNMSPAKKQFMLYPLLGMASLGFTAATQYAAHRRAKVQAE